MGFSLPQLNSCCCGCSLRTGTLILLWISLASSILVFVVEPLATPRDSTNTDSSSSIADKSKHHIGVFDIVLVIIHAAISGLGLYGVYKDLHSYLTPFLAWAWLYLIISFVKTVIINGLVAEVMVGYLIGYVISIYFWLVVYSHYRVLKGSGKIIQA